MIENYTEENRRLRKLTERCIQQLEDVGIHPPEDISLFVEDFEEMNKDPNWYQGVGEDWLAFTTGTRMGSRYIRSEIHVRPSVLRVDISEASSMHVIMHELLHTCAPECEHDGRWLQLVEYVNDRLGYDISEHASHYVSRDIERGERAFQKRREQGYSLRTRSRSAYHIHLGNMNVIIHGDIHLTCRNWTCSGVEIGKEK